MSYLIISSSSSVVMVVSAISKMDNDSARRGLNRKVFLYLKGRVKFFGEKLNSKSKEPWKEQSVCGEAVQ